MPTHKLTGEILAAAIAGFEAQKLRIDEQIAEVRQMLDGGRLEPDAMEAPKGKRRRMSAAARKLIGDAQRKRWAESKRAQPTAPSLAPKPKKRKLSAAGKRAIVEATKKRWAAFHAAQRAERQVVARKGAGKKTAVKGTRKKVGKAPEAAGAVTG